MTIPKVKYTFNNVAVGTSAGNGVPIAGWFVAGQGGNASESIVAGSETNRLKVNSEPGLWVTCFDYNQTYADCDFTANVNSYLLFLGVRVIVDSAVAPTGYGVLVNPAGGAVQIYIACGSTPYVQANFPIAPFSNDFKIRIIMQGQILSVYINDAFVGDFDFTGVSPCTEAFSGYISMTTINSTIIFDPGDKTPSYILMS